MSDNIFVVKRDGTKEILNIDKIQVQVSRACQGISDVSPSMIEIAAKIQFENNMTSETIDKLLLRAMIDLIDVSNNPDVGHTNYQYVAGRHRVSMLRKEVYGKYEPDRLYDIVKKNIAVGLYTPELLEWYSESEWNEIESFIDHEKDEKYSYAAIEQLIEKYLVKNRVTKQVYETPQVRYAIAAATAFHMETKNRLRYVREYYTHASDGAFTLATPVLAGLGTNTKQFSSCVLLSAGDSLKSIFSTGEMIANYASKRAGIGLEIGNIRSLGAPIRNGEIMHTGLIPFLKKWFADLRSCCLRPDMMVEVEVDDGKTKLIPISQVKPGMRIKSHDGTKSVFKKVLSFMKTEVPELNQVRLEFENGTIVHCSTNHPIMIFDGKAKEVTPLQLTSDHMVICDGSFTRLLKRDVIQQNDTSYVDIEVEDTHTFFTSQDESSPQILTHNSQGGIRNASATVNLPIFHYQFDDFIVLKNNQGTDENRIRQLDYCVVLSAFFWKRFKDNGKITFFDPNEVPDLYNAFYSDVALFEELYVKYENTMGLRKKTELASVVFKDWLLKERTDTGRIYLMYVDNVIQHTPFNVKTHPIRQSNLCLTGDTPVEVIINGEFKTLPISKVSAMDNVLIKGKHLESNESVFATVSAAGLTGFKKKLILIEDEETGKSIRCTPEHLIYTKNRGWVEARDLKENDLLDINRSKLGEKKMGLKILYLEEEEDVYDLTVEGVHNFYANDILVHNCCEILLPTEPFERLEDENGRIALCTLGSINWGKYRHPAEMEGAAKILVRALSNILGYQDFLSIQSKLANEEFEPLGVGITNLAYWHAKRGLQYGAPEALAQVKRWMEHQAYFLTEATVQLAKEKGACKLSHTTSYGKGIFPWEKRSQGVNELTDFTPSASLDWEGLRQKMIQYGVRNAVLMAIAPVESSSVVVESTNGIEMPMSLVSVKESKAGSLVQVVPEYAKLKNKYQLMWDQKDCIEYIKTACVLAAYVDQSISTNTFYSPKHFEGGRVPLTLVAKNLMLAHKWGLKTFYYSLLQKEGSKMEKVEEAPLIIASVPEEEESCSACVL